MRTIDVDGRPVHVWAQTEFAELASAQRRAGTVTLMSDCHPVQTLENNPEKLLVEYLVARQLLVLRCGVCGKPVHAVEVA